MIRQSLKQAICAVSLATLPLIAQSAHLSIGMDLSGSISSMFSEEFAKKSCQFVKDEVFKLKHGGTVHLQSFGSVDNKNNLLDGRYTINQRNSSKEVGAKVCRDIFSVVNKPGVSQSTTNIMSFLEYSPYFKCGSGGRVILITDGIEYSKGVNGDALLEGKQSLPDPDPDAAIKGCSVTMYGFAMGRDRNQVRALKKVWSDWFKKLDVEFTWIKPA